MRKVPRFLLEALVAALACYALFAVPMGKRTLAGHVGAVFTTPTAKDAASQIARSVKKLVAQRKPEKDAKGEPEERRDAR